MLSEQPPTWFRAIFAPISLTSITRLRATFESPVPKSVGQALALFLSTRQVAHLEGHSAKGASNRQDDPTHCFQGTLPPTSGHRHSFARCLEDAEVFLRRIKGNNADSFDRRTCMSCWVCPESKAHTRKKPHSRNTAGNDPELDPARPADPPTKAIDKPVARIGKRDGPDARPAQERTGQESRSKQSGNGNDNGTWTLRNGSRETSRARRIFTWTLANFGQLSGIVVQARTLTADEDLEVGLQLPKLN